MSDYLSRLSQSLAPGPDPEIGRLCQAFESDWQAGKAPSIESYLDTPSSCDRSMLFRALLCLELDMRQRQQESPTVKEYTTRFPEFLRLIETVLRESPTVLAAGQVDQDATSSQSEKSKAEFDLPWPEIPGYEVQQQLESGGMGVVYRAREIAGDRVVALKMIRSGIHADAQERARFQLEADAIASLSHPQIVKIFAHGECNGVPYLAMEYAENGSLARLLQAGQLTCEHAAEMLELLAHTAQFIHDRGILHRDLKPANILLFEGGTPKLADFGLAKRLDLDQGLTQTQAILGTASYMAPEQAAGNRQALGPAVDIYALGAILYEALTGRPPFRAQSRELTIQQVLTEEPPRLSRIRSDIPAILEAICLKCLEKEPEQRFATARDLALELHRYRAGEVPGIACDFLSRRARAAQRAGFEILEAFGAPGSTIKYRARLLALNQPAILEICPWSEGKPAGEREAARLRAEGAAQLRHAHIAEFFAFGELDGDWFIAREFVDGQGFDQFTGPADKPEQAAEHVEMLARAVHFAHQKGIVHGRLKPSKAILASAGACKLTGFGSSLQSQDAGSGHAEPEDDIRGLGAVLFQLLTGTSPGSAVSQVESPTPRRDFAGGLWWELHAICRKCLQPNPGLRYPNAAALAEDLRRARTGDVLLIDDLDEWSQQLRWASRAGYRIQELLGQNDSGFTYRAQHLELGRTVVLKRISAKYRFVPFVKERFRMNGRLLAGSRHANIARLYEQGEQNDLVYFAREYVEGRSLAEMEFGQNRAEEAIAIVLALTRAIETVHARRVVHGGLNPKCVFVTPGGVPKITSFHRENIQRLRTRQTLPEQEIAYLASFCPPEMVNGARRGIEPEDDIYALGAILRTLLTGRPPASDKSVQGNYASIPKTPAVFLKAMSICDRCLHAEPTSRLQSAQDLASVLEELLE